MKTDDPSGERPSGVDLTFHAARSRVAVAGKPALLTLPSAARRRIFQDGPPLGFPLLTRLSDEGRETHYPLAELASLVLEMRKLAIPWERDAELTAFRQALLAAAGRARDQQMDLYAIPAGGVPLGRRSP